MENTSCVEESPSNSRKGGSSPRQPVKSTAIVKYSAVNTPVHFERLKFNTDLNLPPSNWLKSSTESYGLHHVLTHSSGFSSFRIAHMFPDCVGEVDVVSDAENIKKLLKIPYSRGPDKALLSYRNNTRHALQQKSLVSKFLHYSLVEPERSQEGVNQFSLPMPLRTCEHPLPEPRFEEGIPDSSHDHKFTRNVVWTFEDIQMLLGTDMPIFGGSTHPCISLRLRDVAKPISVLTGIDYWLDNLMSNVPEVVMCYHLDGIVQKYELIKTEDLPHLPDAKFSPKLIRDVAQNILSFLKSNATKAGHTYWLFKGRDDDVVKLYDLSSLCSDTLVDKGQNPFTVPVGMLLYRVARNMKQSKNGSNTQPGTIRMLLKNSLSLLPKEKYPQIVTSAHYMLSDLYVPLDTDPLSPQLLDEPLTEDSTEDEEEEESMMSHSVPVTDLCISTHQSVTDKYIHPPPLVGTLEERCKMALHHVTEGLDCLQYFDSTDNNSNARDNKSQEEEPQMAKPFQAIPMPYEKINNSWSENTKEGQSKGKDGKNKKKKKSEGKTLKKENHQNDSSETIGDTSSLKALLCKSQGEAMPTWQQPDKMDNASWKKHLQHLLLVKARLVYTTLAEQHYQGNRFGLSLKYLSGVLSCSEDGRMLGSLMLARAGDCCLRIVKDWDNIETHRADLALNETIIKLSDKKLDSCPDIPTQIESVKQLLVASLRCYEKASKYHPNENFTCKLGNAHNELGSMYMNQAAAMFQSSQKCIGTEEFQMLLKDSEKHLVQSLRAFESISDNANVALIHSNTGRLMRLKAHSSSSSTHLTNIQREFYNKAQNSYLAALSVLKTRKTNPMVWDSVTWELSTTLFTIATLTQDHPFFINKTQEEIERDVADLLLKALKYCDLETPGPRLPVYQFRGAKIHHRLASLYHNSYREQLGDEAKKKNLLQLCQMHYMKASKLLFHLEHPSDLLTVQLERVSLAEFICELSSSSNLKLKSLQNALDIIYECRPILVIMEERNRVLPSKISREYNRIDDMEIAERQEEDKLMLLLEQRFQFLLRTLIKLLLTGSNQKSTTPCEKVALASQYKDVYSLLLKKGNRDLVPHLILVIDKTKDLKKI